MAATSKVMVTEPERRFPVRIRVALPDGGLGPNFITIHEWLDQNAGADGWTMTSSGTRGIVNDALAILLRLMQRSRRVRRPMVRRAQSSGGGWAISGVDAQPE